MMHAPCGQRMNRGRAHRHVVVAQKRRNQIGNVGVAPIFRRCRAQRFEGGRADERRGISQIGEQKRRFLLSGDAVNRAQR